MLTMQRADVDHELSCAVEMRLLMMMITMSYMQYDDIYVCMYVDDT